MAVVAIVIVLLFALAFPFADTIRGIAEFFDVRAIRRFLRQRRKAAVTLGGLAAFFALLWFLVSGPDDSPLLFLSLVPLVVVPSLALVWLIVSDIWEVMRDHRRRNRRRRQAPQKLLCARVRGHCHGNADYCVASCRIIDAHAYTQPHGFSQ